MNARSILGSCLAGFGLSCVLAAAHPAEADGYTQLIIFGDSLSDVGNNCRHSAGYLWDEDLAGAYGLTLTPSSKGGTDYAVSGALITSGCISSLPGQALVYLAAHPKIAHAMSGRREP